MKPTWFVFLVMCSVLLWCMAAGAVQPGKPMIMRFDENLTSAPVFESNPTATWRTLDDPGDVVDWDAVVLAAGNYLKQMQADVTEDNAGNGDPDSDPDDAGWDLLRTSPPDPFFHSSNPSPQNLYGATALGLYYAYLGNPQASWFTAMTDAANAAVAAGTASILTAPDMIFLMLYNDLPGVGGTSYKDAAKAKYDWRIANQGGGTATGFAQWLRDVRGITQGYPNGIIGWDLGAYAVTAQMLYDRYGGTYDVDADDIAEVLWQDSFNDNPGLFDVVDDAGWDPNYANVNYWWYNLGISGLIDAFQASGSHTAEIPGLVSRIQASQFPSGAIAMCYGVHADDEDWQTTGYCARSLHRVSPTSYRTEIGRAAYWIAATQHSSGGWLYSNGDHYPEVVAECVYAVTLGASNVDLGASSMYVGCPSGSSCTKDTLYLYFDRTGYYSGQVILQLPTGLLPDWSGNYSTAPSPATANLQMVFSRILGGNQVEVNVLWGPDPDRSVNDGLPFAQIPVYNTSNVHGTILSVTPVSAVFVDAGGYHTDLTVGTISITVDCEAPAVALTGGGGEAGCNAYNSAAEFADALTYSVDAGAYPNSPLDHAYIMVNATQVNLSSYSGTWPSAGDAATIWALMTEGCNTFVLHGFDTECNHGTTTAVTVIKDTTPITLTVVNTSPAWCYNNLSGDPYYGGTELDDYLDITSDLAAGAGAGCFASTGTISIESATNPGSPYVINLPPDVSLFPDAGNVLAFWNWMISRVPGANGNETFNLTATDCAGNVSNSSFTVCMDLTIPNNTFIVFDARPTHLGVWLKWQWTYDAAQAVEVEIYRKGEGDYPVYASDLWVSDANYDKVRSALSGWTLVATQAGPNNTSVLYPGTHGGPGNQYWLDAIGTNGAPLRDIYRYITFVRDNGNNWSVVSNYTICTNADRSTNYWLGDYSFHGTNPAPYGEVNTADLSLLSAHYFESVLPAFDYLDIGPEQGFTPAGCAQGYGKNIPNPDGYVDFLDLVPFSFNFGMVAPGGYSIEPPANRTFENLDAMPSVRLIQTGGREGSFTVSVALNGNSGASVKAVEAHIKYDPRILEVADMSSVEFEVVDGMSWSTVRPLPHIANEIGVAAAALGEAAAIGGDGVLATVTFRYKSESRANTALELNTVRLADLAGATTEGAGMILNLGSNGTLPTEYALYQNYPNPFNPSTKIAFDLVENGFVTLRVFNLLGQTVATLVSTDLSAGHHEVSFDATALSSGLYLYRLETNGFVAEKKLLIMK